MEEMCSCFWQKMDADHGDLGDVVRRGAGGGCGVPPRAGQHVLELAGFPPPEASNDDFGDPFSSFRDPLLHDLGGGAAFFGGADTVAELGQAPVAGSGGNFSRVLQISSATKAAAPTVSPPAVLTPSAILSGEMASTPLDQGEFQISSPPSPDMKRRS